MILYIMMALFVLGISLFPNNTIIRNQYTSYILFFGLSLLFLFKSSTFPYAQFSDMSIYIRETLKLSGLPLKSIFLFNDKDILFLGLQWGIAQITNSEFVIRLLFSTIFFLLFSLAINKFTNYKYSLFLLFAYLNFTFFYNYVLVAVRQGLAISLVFLAIGYSLNSTKHTWQTWFLLGLAPFFHWSALPLAIIIAFKIYETSTKNLLVLWFIASILYITELHKNLINFLLSNIAKVSSYVDSSGGIINESQMKFYLFSLFWVVFALIMLKYIKDEFYMKVVNIYIVFNIVFLLLGYIPYSDRVASYSWMIIPLLIWIPISKSRSYRKRIILFCSNLIILLIGIFTGILKYYH